MEKVCPIAGYKSNLQAKLSNHFDNKHQDLVPTSEWDLCIGH